jgi:hypothetical protein
VPYELDAGGGTPATSPAPTTRAPLETRFPATVTGNSDHLQHERADALTGQALGGGGGAEGGGADGVW